MATHLSPHFTLEELTHSQAAARLGFHNSPKHNSPEYKNLLRLAETMEQVRVVCNSKPILISSGYRQPNVNAAVGGSKTSVHMQGLAADFICPEYGTPLEICKALEPHMRSLHIDQLIHEFNTWVHLGLMYGGPPRHMTLTIDSNGTREGFARA